MGSLKYPACCKSLERSSPLKPCKCICVCIDGLHLCNLCDSCRMELSEPCRSFASPVKAKVTNLLPTRFARIKKESLNAFHRHGVKMRLSNNEKILALDISRLGAPSH